MDNKSSYFMEIDNILNSYTQKQINLKGSPFISLGTGSMGHYILSGLRKEGIEPVALCDNNQSVIGNKIYDIDVMSKDEVLKKYGSDILMIVTIFNGNLDKAFDWFTILKDLQIAGFNNIIHCQEVIYSYPKYLMPYFYLDDPAHLIENKDNILAVYRLLKDNLSKRLLFEQLDFRMRLNKQKDISHITEKMYFLDEIYTKNKDEVFMDLGAFTGDTIDDFLEYSRNFKNIVSLEPDTISYKSLTEHISKLDGHLKNRIDTYPYAAGDIDGMICFDSNGISGSTVSSDAAEQVRSIKIDTLCEEISCTPTMIKMDLEGYEYHALKGAEHTIKTHKPILIICLYHKQEDIWELPLLIKSYDDSDDYSFYIRQHLRNFLDTVLYAVPRKRIR